MKISPELLRRYASGDCSEEERRLVEAWIPDETDLAEDIDWKDVQHLKSSAWRNLSRDLLSLPLTSQPRRSLLKYASAACLLIGLVSVLMLSENASSSLHAEASNREIHRLVRSSGTISMDQARIDSTFQSRPIAVLTECLHEGCVPEWIELQPEDIFYSIRFQEGSDQAVIVGAEELKRFTPALWRRIVSISLLPS